MRLVRWLQLHWDRVTGWCAIAAGAVALLVGWIGASGTPYPAGQLPYLLSGGLGGIFLLGLGGTLLLSADLRDEWGKLHRIERMMQCTGGGERPDPTDPSRVGSPFVSDNGAADYSDDLSAVGSAARH